MDIKNRAGKVVWKANVYVFLFSIFIFLTAFNIFSWMNEDGYSINLSWADMTDSTHTFKLYNSWTDAVSSKNPIDSLTLDILPTTGDYRYAPDNSHISSNKFRQWKAIVNYNRSYFTLSKFRQTMESGQWNEM